MKEVNFNPPSHILSKWLDVRSITSDELVLMVDEILNELKRRKWERAEIEAETPFPVPPID